MGSKDDRVLASADHAVELTQIQGCTDDNGKHPKRYKKQKTIQVVKELSTKREAGQTVFTRSRA
jgi:hypothetical protein